MHDLDRKAAARHDNHGRIEKVAGQLGSIEGRRSHDDTPQSTTTAARAVAWRTIHASGPPVSEHTLRQGEEDVGVQRALVRFVQH